MSDVEYELVPIGAFKTEAQKILPSEEKEEKK